MSDEGYTLNYQGINTVVLFAMAWHTTKSPDPPEGGRGSHEKNGKLLFLDSKKLIINRKNIQLNCKMQLFCYFWNLL